MSTVIVVGSGQAGFQAAASLRDKGFTGRVVLVGDEPGVPYQRPPLSKAYLAGTTVAEKLHLRPEAFFATSEIELVSGRVESIDRANALVVLEDGTKFEYDHLVLATGARNRTLPVPGAGLRGVLTLRTRDDADRLRAALEAATDVVVIGGGFIGLEFAAHAGRPVTVVEAQDRLMARVVTPEISAHFARLHEAAGTKLLLGQGVAALHGSDSAVESVELTDGTLLPADLVVVGVGVLPATDLAADAGLIVDNGIVVDDQLRTSDPAVSAIGDCANFPSVHARCATRLESVQNAVDQARFVAARITGEAVPYTLVPWFWTDQLGAKLQIAGIGTGYDHIEIAGDPGEGKFFVLSFMDGVLVAVESVSKPSDHISARRLLSGERAPTLEELRESEFNLKEHLKSLSAV
ncbi:MAG: 3-phenylpropionate/trans-cinnamate dioxygenase ferredoxin reductase component [Actinomycetota bacterium]|nr:3-phenylpropionate/trans-cinnamate dioxygenase ferredoxin reductase component [Actinomycetota bacterium]